MTDTPNGGHTPPGGYAAYLTGRLESLGLSRNALARALGHRGASQVSRWCAGKAVPREKARAKIEAALMVHANHIEHQRQVATDYREAMARIAARQTLQDAPGGPISGGEGYEGTPFVVERYVVEGG